MKHAYLAAISAAALLAAPAAQAWDLSYDVSLGGIQFEDDVDVDTLTAMAFGGEIIAEQVGAGGLTYSLAFRGEAYDGDFSGSNDHTRWYREISYAVTGPSLYHLCGSRPVRG